MPEYYDRELGVLNHNDRKHFEFLILEAAQAGLSWSIVLNKREGYRRAFSQFDPEKVARYSKSRIDKRTADPAIIRNRMKIEAAVKNAGALLAVQEEFGSFDKYCWQFVDGKARQNRWKSMRQIPATMPESDKFSRDLKKRGFSFVGPTVIYAHMQAIGMVNDHWSTASAFAPSSAVYPRVRVSRHVRRASRAGQRACPQAVSAYSTFGGTCACTIRLTMPSRSSCLSCCASIFCVTPGIARSRSENRSTLPPKR